MIMCLEQATCQQI